MGDLIRNLISIFFKILLILLALWLLRAVLRWLQFNFDFQDIVWMGVTLLVLWLLAEFLQPSKKSGK